MDSIYIYTCIFCSPPPLPSYLLPGCSRQTGHTVVDLSVGHKVRPHFLALLRWCRAMMMAAGSNGFERIRTDLNILDSRYIFDMTPCLFKSSGPVVVQVWEAFHHLEQDEPRCVGANGHCVRLLRPLRRRRHRLRACFDEGLSAHQVQNMSQYQHVLSHTILQDFLRHACLLSMLQTRGYS